MSSIANQYRITQRQYADDTQLYIVVSNSDNTREIHRLEACLLAMHAWFYPNGLALNPDKTDTIVFGTYRRSQLAAAMTSVNVAGVLVKQSDKIKLIGATLDNKLTLTGHVNAVCKATFFHIRALCHIRRVLTEDTAKTGACVLVCLIQDYANSILHGVLGANIHKL